MTTSSRSSGRSSTRATSVGPVATIRRYLHALVLDGAYTAASPFARPQFHDAPELTEEDVHDLVETIRARVLRLLRARGLLTDDGNVSLGEVHEEADLLPLLQAASIQGRVVQGSDAGAPLEGLNRIPASGSRFRPPPLCAEVDGFSLHAAVRIAADDRDRLEHLCRYVARPPFAAERLSLTPDGRAVHELRRAWRDGTTHVVFEPRVFLERLAALVPPPRAHQQTYHGILAPGSSWRDDVVIASPAARHTDSASSDEAADPSARPAHRYLWSELMLRVFGIDALRCNHCRSRRRLVSLITERSYESGQPMVASPRS